MVKLSLPRNERWGSNVVLTSFSRVNIEFQPIMAIKKPSTTMQIHDIRHDDRNANKGSKRGLDAVTQSLRELGAGRSILVDRDGRVIAGNKTLQASLDLNRKELQVIQSDGTRLVVVQRTDLSLDDAKGRKLAIADNRSSELGLEWDPRVLTELATELDLQPFFTESELATIADSKEKQSRPSQTGEVNVDDFDLAHKCPRCGFAFNE